MGPGLLAGDRVATGRWPFTDRWRKPARFERWIVAALDGTPALKRVVGLPGEVVSIRGGDLAIDGRIVVAPPSILAETATCVASDPAVLAPDPAGTNRWCWRIALPDVLDDAAFAPHERRVLLPVRDVGLAAIVRVADAAGADCRLTARVDERRIHWRLAAPGRYAIIAGRLDGHLVGTVWPIGSAHGPATPRRCLPPGCPEAWDVAVAWPGNDGPPQALELGLGPVSSDEAAQSLEWLALWRDVLWRPAADQTEAWRLGTDKYFLFGDFPSGSRDSRHWGALDRHSLRHRVPRRD